MRRGKRPGRAIGIGLGLIVAWGPLSRAQADCGDRTIAFEGTVSVVCTGDTSPETDDYDPGATGCVLAFGSSVPTPGRDLVYAVTLPAQWVLDVVVTPNSSWDPAVYAAWTDVPESLPDSCIAGVDAGFDGDPEVLAGLGNDSPEERVLYLFIDSASTSSTFGSGPFTVEFRPNPRPAAGDACDGDGPIQVDLADGDFELSLTTCGATHAIDVIGGECGDALGFSLGGRDLVFEISVPDSSEWWAEVVPDDPWDVALCASTACDMTSGTCLAVSDRGGVGASEETRHISVLSGTGNPATHYLAIDSPIAAGQVQGCGGFDLRIHRREITSGTGRTCVEAIDVSLGNGDFEPLDGWSCDGGSFSGTDGSPCGVSLDAPLTGLEVVYAVTVELADGIDWAVQVVPRGPWDPAILVASDCNASTRFWDTCLGAVDAWGPGKAEILTGLPGGTGQTYFVYVDGTLGECGAFDVYFRAGSTPVERTTWSRLKSRYR